MATPSAVVEAAVALLNEQATGEPAPARDWPEAH
jgi:hypothetical protein